MSHLLPRCFVNETRMYSLMPEVCTDGVFDGVDTPENLCTAYTAALVPLLFAALRLGRTDNADMGERMSVCDTAVSLGVPLLAAAVSPAGSPIDKKALWIAVGSMADYVLKYADSRTCDVLRRELERKKPRN